VASTEGLTLDSLDLNDTTTYVLEALSMTPPKKRSEWITGGDTDGAVLARDALFENREVVARIRIVAQSTMDLALSKIAAITDKLEEAERNQTGVALQWTPADATLTTGTFRCLSGEITDLPIMVDGDGAGWFVKTPIITVTMTCDPFMRGPETGPTSTSASTLPLVTVELTSVAGDVPAEGRLVVTDAASQSRRLVRWGLESRYYPTSSPPGLLLDSDSLVTSGFAGTGTTRTGAYDPGAAGNSVIRGTLALSPIAVCGTGVQTHVGTFHVFARIYATETTSGAVNYIRLTWQDGEGPLRSNLYTAPPLNAEWADVDLGIITTTTAVSGTQKWIGRIDAYSTAVGETLDVDYIYLVPAQEGYGEARGQYAYATGVLVARDEFTSFTAATVLNARVAPTGGTWATSGVATDFTAADAPLATDETVTRATVSEASQRFAILGATSYTDTEASIDVYATALPAGLTHTLIARWVDSSNYLAFTVSSSNVVSLQVFVAGVSLGNVIRSLARAVNTWYRLRVVVFTSGAAIATLMDVNGATLTTLQLQHSSLATGGALATGKPGFADRLSVATATTRYYDRFSASTPNAEPIVVYSGRTAEIRSTAALRPDSTGTYYGDVPAYRGSRFFVPPAGTRTRKARIAVMARRNDVVVTADNQIADSTTIQAYVTPRYLNVPR
jgi:hypothetical protein